MTMTQRRFVLDNDDSIMVWMLTAPKVVAGS